MAKSALALHCPDLFFSRALKTVRYFLERHVGALAQEIPVTIFKKGAAFFVAANVQAGAKYVGSEGNPAPLRRGADKRLARGKFARKAAKILFRNFAGFCIKLFSKRAPRIAISQERAEGAVPELLICEHGLVYSG